MTLITKEVFLDGEEKPFRVIYTQEFANDLSNQFGIDIDAELSTGINNANKAFLDGVTAITNRIGHTFTVLSPEDQHIFDRKQEILDSLIDGETVFKKYMEFIENPSGPRSKNDYDNELGFFKQVDRLDKTKSCAVFVLKRNNNMSFSIEKIPVTFKK